MLFRSLETIPDEDEPEETRRQSSTSHTPPSFTISNIQHASGRQGSETPSQEGTKSRSPSASTITTLSFSEFSLPQGARADWSHLSADIQHYLGWFVDNLTHFHYCLPLDADDFFKTIFPNVAVRNEPLLNALVGFSAYHETLQNPNGKLEDFLGYYNKSVTLLLGFLKKKERSNVAILLTVLQLATIEVSSPPFT